MVILLMGVAGSGKTAVGEGLAARLGWRFIDGDELHSPASVEKMRAGIPLDDEDRMPWLRSIRDLIDEHEATGTPVIIACSALKQVYRRLLLEGTRETRLVYLRGEQSLIESRLRERQNHFFDPRLLGNQFAVLEEPRQALLIDIDADLESVTDAVVEALGLDSSAASEEDGQ